MKGFTLIEILVVVSIISIMTYFSAVSVISFQRESKLDNFGKEFASTLMTAKNRSVNSEYPPNLPDFDEENSFNWALSVYNDKYTLKFKYIDKNTGANEETETDIYPLSSGNSVTPLGDTDFARLTGKTSAKDYCLRVSGNTETRVIHLDINGELTINNNPC